MFFLTVWTVAAAAYRTAGKNQGQKYGENTIANKTLVRK